MSKLVTIYGGSGFVGRYIAQQMASKGWRVRVAVRRPNEAMYVKPYGTPGQVEPILCNIRNDVSVSKAMHGADAVINCVGILNEAGKNSFEAVQVEGAERIARAASELGINRMVHVSAIGADADSSSTYSKTKSLGEAAILRHLPDAVILRPSVIFGNEDGFFNRFAGMSRMGPVLPLVGSETLFQPVYVEDVARAAVMAATGEAKPGIYELGGPEIASLRDWVTSILKVVHRRRLVINMPFWLARVMALGFDVMQAATVGLVAQGRLTRDQVKNLAKDNIVSGDVKTFAELGIRPTSAEAVIESYLWRYRPSGQYDAIRDSAKNLKI